MGCLKIDFTKPYLQDYEPIIKSLNKNLTSNKTKKNTQRAYYFGFNGIEKNDEIYGEGITYIAEFGAIDSRLGRRFNLDPKPIISFSPYSTFANNPILTNDVLLDSPITSVTKLNFDKIEDNYDSDGESILQKEKCLEDLKNKNTNTCAIKLSNALNKSEYTVPKSEETPSNVRVRTGKKGDNGNYVLDAASMKNYLSSVEKPTMTFKINKAKDIDKMLKKIQSKYDDVKGIITYVVDKPGKYGATGHTDLIYEDWAWDLSFNSGTDVGPYLKDKVLPKSTFTVYIWVMDYDKE
ncbi:MAG: T6SS effector amidase Tae4 family protein [Chitinophagales bacterium]|jgi:hypothetical protein